jgi:hypothetical protein
MTAEPIAKVIADLQAGRVERMGGTAFLKGVMANSGNDKALSLLDDHKVPDKYNQGLFDFTLSRAQDPNTVVIDATDIYESLTDTPKPVYIYEDHPCIAPPFESMAVCYVNQHENVIVMHANAWTLEEAGKAGIPQWETAQPVEWDRVKWILETFIWIGGKGGGTPNPTCGPVHSWRFAIYENGEPADLSWVQLVPEYPMERWDMAHLVLLGALNFLACNNVEVVDPQRPRGERRRIERTGVIVKTINVFPPGKRTQSGSAGTGGSVPLSSVRGHFSAYGPEYGRGLLFGKISGRFWIPQHARGSKEYGETEHDYKLVVK